jgi:hypothetical protein
MKTKLLFVMSLLALMSWSCSDNDNGSIDKSLQTKSQEDLLSALNITRTDDAYNYPLVPGTDAWKAIINEDEKLAADEIPEATLNKMSNEALVIAWVESPFTADWIAFDNYQLPFDSKLIKMNLYKAMKERKGMSNTLAKTLNGVPFVESNSTNEAWPIFPAYEGLELLCGQEDFIPYYSKEEMKQMVEKRENLDYSTENRAALFLIARLLNHYNLFSDDNSGIENRIKTGVFYEVNKDDSIIKSKIPEFYKLIGE